MRFVARGRRKDISVHPWDNGRPLEEGEIVGTIVGDAFLGHTVRLEVQLRDGKLNTGALPTHEAITTNLEPGSPVTFPSGSCQAFPHARRV